MDVSNKTIKQIIEENKLSNEEIKWLEKMISMIMCLRKYERLNNYLIEKERNEEKNGFT